MLQWERKIYTLDKIFFKYNIFGKIWKRLEKSAFKKNI